MLTGVKPVLHAVYHGLVAAGGCHVYVTDLAYWPIDVMVMGRVLVGSTCGGVFNSVVCCVPVSG